MKYGKEILTLATAGIISSIAVGIYKTSATPDGLMHYRALFEDHPGYVFPNPAGFKGEVFRVDGMPEGAKELHKLYSAAVKAKNMEGQVEFEGNLAAHAFFSWEAFNSQAYRPVNFTHPNVLWNDAESGRTRGEVAPDGSGAWDVVTKSMEKFGGWADPADIRLLYQGVDPRVYWDARTNGKKIEGDIRYSHHAIELIAYEEDQFAGSFYPRNPVGPTGLRGRGLLGNWAGNQAADPLITRINLALVSEANPYGVEFIMIKRIDNGQWALPGGMLERADGALPKGPMRTALRELFEEAGVGNSSVFETLFEVNSHEIYTGYVDDPRNTDNAWMETVVAHLHLTDALAAQIPANANIHKLKAGDDADAAKWAPVGGDDYKKLFASHKKFVDLAVVAVASAQAAAAE